MSSGHVAIVVAGLARGGGAERVMIHLANLLSRRGLPVDVVVPSLQPAGARDVLAEGVNLVELRAGHFFSSMRLLNRAFRTKNLLLFPWACVVFVWKLCASTWALRQYIRRSRPRLLLTTHYNSITIVANRLAGRPSQVVITEHTLLSEHLRRQPWPVRVAFSRMCRLFYPSAARVVGVSRAVMEDLVAHFRVPASRADFIYNPVVGPELRERAAEPCDHPWLRDRSVPTLVSVARLSPEKDFVTLLEAFALLRRERPLRLIVLGDGADREMLLARARALGVDGDVDWHGMVANPLPYVREADAMVLSTFYEGLPTVLIEALLVGTTPVATDAPGGIREVLDGGRCGYIVPVQDAPALAEGIRRALERPIPPETLRARAEFFSDDRALKSWLALLRGLGIV